MSVACPYCRHHLAPRRAAAGHYVSHCPHCRGKFVLLVPDAPDVPVKVARIKGEAERFAQETQAAPRTEPDPATEDATAWRPGPGAATVPPGPAATLPAPPAGPDARADATPPDLETAAFGPESILPSLGAGPVPKRLGGYQVLRVLGRGQMGTVYLARQLSLNRNVALKVMNPRWAADATFLARFTREAYAAAQLAHHNVVPIYDFGSDRGTTYFSTEFVEGGTLDALVRARKRLDPEEAVGYVLQAARGLKAAHDQGMIHRDVKPENLLINADGVVKVADLGLVKNPAAAEADEAAANIAGPTPAPASPPGAEGPGPIALAGVVIGTPAFMAPEQARDAARVDARADIYSLGCTLYALLTGQPPFRGATVIEVLTRHQNEPITPPGLVPRALSDILMKMVAKRPEDRYPNLAAVIAALEGYLGVHSTGSFTPREEHADRIGQAAAAFHASPAARLRAWVVPAALGGLLALALLALLAGRPFVGGGLLGLALLTALADFLVGGLRRKSYFFSRVREYAFGSRLADALTAVALLAVLAALLYAFNLLWAWLALAGAAACTALALDVALDRKAEAERRAPLDDARNLLRSLRLHGLEEDALRQFVCKYSGTHWEEFYEALFGYEARLEARERWGRAGGKARPRFAPWRDPIIARIEAARRRRAGAKEEALLQKIEENALHAQGENLVTARRKARRAAAAMVTVATEIRATQAATRRDDTVPVNLAISRTLREAAVKPESVLVTRESGLLEERRPNPLLRLAAAAVGPRVRFLAGAALLAGCLVWMKQNDMLSADQAQAVVSAARAGDLDALKDQAKSAAERARGVREPRALQAPGLPPALLSLLSSFGAGAAGLILIASACVSGARIALFAVPAAAVTLLGHRAGLPVIRGLDPSLAPAALGALILGFGLLFGRSRA